MRIFVFHKFVYPQTDMVSDVAYKTGTMAKDPRDITDAERAVWQAQCADDARTWLFSIGQPLVYRNDTGQLVAEYTDGRIEALPEPVTA